MVVVTFNRIMRNAVKIGKVELVDLEGRPQRIVHGCDTIVIKVVAQEEKRSRRALATHRERRGHVVEPSINVLLTKAWFPSLPLPRFWRKKSSVKCAGDMDGAADVGDHVVGVVGASVTGELVGGIISTDETL